MKWLRNQATAQVFTVVVLAVMAARAQAVEHRVEVLNDAPPSGELAAPLAALLGGPAFRVLRGESRVVCEVWLNKEWPLPADAKPPGDVIYPFQPGQLLGVVRFPRKGADFRDQVIASGIYTLRYGQQPVDGAHVGTSPTRDFLVLIKVSDDDSLAPLDYKTLITKSAQAAGSKHPLLLSLQRASAEASDAPTLEHREDNEWFMVNLRGTVRTGDKKEPLPVKLVVVGKASE
ncbi:MAG: hypothetical protein U0935_17555 [Pirellulales bacterium]